MKIGFLSESPADQAALAVFTEGILGEPPESINMDLQGRSVTELLRALDGVYRGVHYNSDAEGLVVVVDSDESAIHVKEHESLPTGKANCRLCKLRRIVARAQIQVKSRQGRPKLKVALGLAVPAMEAWYLVGKEHEIGEAAWLAQHHGFTKSELKKRVYGTDRPSLQVETECAGREARRVVVERKLDLLKSTFPAGFGRMAQVIESWKPPPQQVPSDVKETGAKGA